MPAEYDVVWCGARDHVTRGYLSPTCLHRDETGHLVADPLRPCPVGVVSVKQPRRYAYGAIQAHVLEIVRAHPSVTAEQVWTRMSTRMNSVSRKAVGTALSNLQWSGVITRERRRPSSDTLRWVFRYSPVEGARDE